MTQVSRHANKFAPTQGADASLDHNLNRANSTFSQPSGWDIYIDHAFVRLATCAKSALPSCADANVFLIAQ